jgi:replicative DNA helicase
MAIDTVPFPTLDDLIGSSAIQNSADKVVMVFNPNDATLNESGVRPAFLKISKYRNGRSGSKLTVFFEAKYTRFVDCDWRYEGGECGDYDSMFHD